MSLYSLAIGLYHHRAEVDVCLGHPPAVLVHDIYWHPYLSTEHKEERCVSSCWIDTGVVGQAESTDMVLPLRRIVTNRF